MKKKKNKSVVVHFARIKLAICVNIILVLQNQKMFARLQPGFVMYSCRAWVWVVGCGG